MWLCYWPPLEAAPRRLPSTSTAEVLHLLLPSFARLPRETIMPSFIVAIVQPVRCSALGVPSHSPSSTACRCFILHVDPEPDVRIGPFHLRDNTGEAGTLVRVRSNSASNE